MAKLLGLLFIILSYSQFSLAINCAMPKLNVTEKTICQSEELLAIDHSMHKSFTFYKKHSLSEGSLKRAQKKFIEERDACKDNIVCIQETYTNQFIELDKNTPFQHLEKYFTGEIDPPFEKEIINDDGFTIKDNPWLIKYLFSVNQLRNDLNLNIQYPQIIGHSALQDDSYIFIVGSDKNFLYLIAYSLQKSNFIIVQSYQQEQYGRHLYPVQQNDTKFIFYIENYNNKTMSFFRIQSIDGKTFESTKIEQPTEQLIKASQNNNKWVGNCDNEPCTSYFASPNRQYQIAQGSEANQYIYVFNKANPNKGLNIFIRDKSMQKLFDEGFSFFRSFSWGGNEHEFFFDNEGGYACIWKTNFKTRITERILPVESLIRPYYLSYKNKEYVIAYDHQSNIFYIATQPF